MLRGRSLQDYVASILRADADNYSDPSQFLSRNSYFFAHVEEPSTGRSLLDKGDLTSAEVKFVIEKLSEIPSEDWSKESLEIAIKEAFKTLPLNNHHASFEKSQETISTQVQRTHQPQFYKFLRETLTQGKPGLGMMEVMVILGRETSLDALGRSVKY